MVNVIMTDEYDYNKVSGLMNMGNTCFMNSALQLLFSCPMFVKFFIDNTFNDLNIIKYQTTFKDYFRKSTRGMGPKILYNRYKDIHGQYDGFSQEDAHEYLTFIIDDLDTLISKLNATILGFSMGEFFKRLVVVQMKLSITCQHCGFFYCGKMPENILTLSINNQDNLIDCFNNLVKVERLEGDNQWKCDRCKCNRDAEKKVIVSSFPKYLFISLNRYIYQNGNIIKNEHSIDIPFSWQHSGNTYVLHGLICHVGNMTGGHYFSFVNRDNKWYFINDNQIEETCWDEIKKSFSLVYVVMFARI